MPHELRRIPVPRREVDQYNMQINKFYVAKEKSSLIIPITIIKKKKEKMQYIFENNFSADMSKIY